MDNLQGIYEFIISNKLIMLLLAIDTCRAFLAALGIIPRHWSVIGRIIYGKRDEDLVRSVLLQLGYGPQRTKKIIDRITNKKSSEQLRIVNPEGNLLNILSQYTTVFESEISYGSIAKDKKASYSRYYISTMDAVHDAKSLECLTIIMAKLIAKFHLKNLDFIIVPKGGNPILAQNVALKLGIDLVIAKDQNDSARPLQAGAGSDKQLLFEIQYEGIKKVLDKDKRKKIGILLDCNTSGGTQLRYIVEEFNKYISYGDNNIEPIKDVFVLFKLSKRNENEKNFDKSFSDIGCTLHRYFDLDENDKSVLAGIPNDEYYSNVEQLDALLNDIKEKKHFHYE